MIHNFASVTVALGFGVTATIGPVVDPPLAVIVCVFVSTSGLVVGAVVSKNNKHIIIRIYYIINGKITVLFVICTFTSIGVPFK